MFIEPKTAIDSIDLLPGMTVADFGAGAGFYTIYAAKRVGDSGKIYAIDIRKETLEIIRSKAKAEKLSNIETLWGNLEKPEGSHLKTGSMDVVIISNILFQAEDSGKIAEEAWRILKSGGRVFVVEWLDDGSSLGPPKEQRRPKSDVRELFGQHHFQFEKEFDAGTHHYGLIFKKV